jgi:hypothetical protein
MLAGVGVIEAEGLPGGFVCVSTNAFGVVAGKNSDETILPVVAASVVEKGRVVVLGHSSFITAFPSKGDTERFLGNALAWLAKGKRGASVAVYRADDFARGLQATGFKVEATFDLRAAMRCSVIAAPAGAFAVEDFEKVREFVANGGGLLTCGIGWGWKNIAQNASNPSCLALHCDEQKLLARFGIVMSDLGIHRTREPGVRGAETDFGTLLSEGGYLADFAFPPGTTLPEALALAAKNPRGIADDVVRRQVAKTLTMAADVYPPDKSAAYAAFRAFVRQPGAKKAPSPESPLTSADLAARVRAVLKKNAWLANPVQKWGADVSAKAYPGLVKKGAKPEERREVVIDTTEKRWHSTGLFANAGEPITVKASAKALGLGLKIRVGTTSEEIASAQETWKRFPVVSETIPLTKAETTFASPFGGLVYVVVPNAAPTGQTLRLAIGGAYPAAHFRRGRDTNATWKQTLASAAAPQAELEGERMALTVPARSIATLKDPEWVVKFWDDANALCLKLTGMEKPFDYKQRICSDLQLTSGFLHNGYPMMCHESADGNCELFDVKTIRQKGCWGVLHELGHNHQNAAWTFGAATEVTVNFFTLYCTEKLLGISPRDALEAEGRNMKILVENWKASGKGFDLWAKDPFLALEMFVRLREVYGWELFEKLFAEYRRPGEVLPKTDQEKMDQWAIRLSKMYNANFASFFVAWSWPISPSARAACAKYPALADKRLFP